jgi:dienelactone hydrolase
MHSARFLLTLVLGLGLTSSAAAQTLPGTRPLTRTGDLAAQMVAGIDKYLMRELAASVEKRKQFWKPDYSAPDAYTKSVQPNRERLKKLLGVVDPRVPFNDLRYVATTGQPALVAQTQRYKVHTVRWPVLAGVDAEGLLLEPTGKAVACVVAIPDADGTPEMLAGLAPGVAAPLQSARRLAENGCRVLVPTLIDRKDTWSGNPKIGRMTNQPHREFIYRMAYEMGRHIIGYEVQKVFAAVDWFSRPEKHPPIAVIGYGEGGMLALYSAALDTRIQAAVVSAYYQPREDVWKEPIYRNIWGLLQEFGDAELAGLVAPRTLIVDDSRGPEVKGPPPPRSERRGAAPGRLGPWEEHHGAARREVGRALTAARAFPFSHPELRFLLGADWLPFLLGALAADSQDKRQNQPAVDVRQGFDPAPRQRRQLDQLVAFTQNLLPDAAVRRQEFLWSKLDTSSLDKYQKSIQPARDIFWEEIIGKLPAPTLPPNARTRLIHDTPKWKGYEVVLDLYDDVFCYGILLVPNDLKPGERRPVVVCQHGLEGRPADIVNPKVKTKYYNSFGAQLADRGYVVFAPQNPYIGGDAFRVLNRKGNPLKLSLYSFIVRQHERILDWLVTLPFVDASRIAYYGLSYGGKVAMRIPALLGRYCAVICAGDFNEWIWKNINLIWTGSYMFTGEYEMFEFDLGNTFNYAEMAALIAPRPFMVERGHNDGVGLDEYVAFEYAKVRRLYARLGLPQRTEIEFFSGGHEIHGQGTFRFLDHHLHWTPTGKTSATSGTSSIHLRGGL